MILVLYGLIRGLLRGFVQELTPILSLVAVVLAVKFASTPLAQWLIANTGMSNTASTILSYLALFIGVALVFALIGKAITSALKAIDLNGINRLIGGLFGSLKWALIVSLIFNLLSFIDPYFELIPQETKQASHLYSPTKRLASIAKDMVDNTTMLHPEETTENE